MSDIVTLELVAITFQLHILGKVLGVPDICGDSQECERPDMPFQGTVCVDFEIEILVGCVCEDQALQLQGLDDVFTNGFHVIRRHVEAGIVEQRGEAIGEVAEVGGDGAHLVLVDVKRYCSDQPDSKREGENFDDHDRMERTMGRWELEVDRDWG